MQSLEHRPHASVLPEKGEVGTRNIGPPPAARAGRARILVAYGSRFGNTRRLAEALARGLHQRPDIEVDCRSVKDVDVANLGRYNLVALGGPTEMFTASKEVKEFLLRSPEGSLAGSNGFAFETKLAMRFSGSAGKYIERRLEHLGVTIVRPYATAIVRAMSKEERAKYGDLGAPEFVQKLEPPSARGARAAAEPLDLLREGEEAVFERIGAELALKAPLRPAP